MDVKKFAWTGTIASLALNGEPVDQLVMTPFGAKGDDHTTADRTYIPRHGEPWQAWWQKELKGQQFFNWRSWTAVSTENRAKLAHQLDMPAINSGGLWENFVFSGIPGFSKLPPGAHLCIYNESGELICVLIVHDQNFPCTKTGKHLYDSHGCTVTKNTFATAFKELAEDLRGVMGYVAYPADPTAEVVVEPGFATKVWMPVNAHHQYI